MANNNDKWEKLEVWVTNAVNEGLARGADCQSGRDKGMYEAYKNVADKMGELDGSKFIIIKCDGNCLVCDDHRCPNRY